VSAPAPGSSEWLRYMTASKIAAVVGTSPYESRFSLWHRMHGDIGPQETTPQMGVGNVLEPALLAWWQSQHPELVLLPTAWRVHPDVEWAAATPDGFAASAAGDVAALVEAKTARDSWEWRDDHVPPGYYDQCQWQMWVTGTSITYVAALVEMSLVERVVRRDDARIGELILAAEEFMASLVTHQAPPIDGSTHTYQAVREMHPDIDARDEEIDPDTAARWIKAKATLAIATTEELAARSSLLREMGDARRALVGKQVIARRQNASRGGVALYQVATAIENQESAA